MIQQVTLNDLKAAFLDKGGVFLRKGANKQGQPTIEHKSNLTHRKWCTRLTFSNEELRDKNFNFLTRKRKQFFKSE